MIRRLWIVGRIVIRLIRPLRIISRIIPKMVRGSRIIGIVDTALIRGVRIIGRAVPWLIRAVRIIHRVDVVDIKLIRGWDIVSPSPGSVRWTPRCCQGLGLNSNISIGAGREKICEVRVQKIRIEFHKRSPEQHLLLPVASALCLCLLSLLSASALSSS